MSLYESTGCHWTIGTPGSPVIAPCHFIPSTDMILVKPGFLRHLQKHKLILMLLEICLFNYILTNGTVCCVKQKQPD